GQIDRIVVERRERYDDAEAAAERRGLAARPRIRVREMEIREELEVVVEIERRAAKDAVAVSRARQPAPVVVPVHRRVARLAGEAGAGAPAGGRERGGDLVGYSGVPS